MVRVLKPGATLEVIEEDLIFPCPDSPNSRTPRASPIPWSRNEGWDDYSAPTNREIDRRSPIFAPPNSDSESDDDLGYDLNPSPKHSPTTGRNQLFRFEIDHREDTDSDEYRPGHSRSSVDTISEGRIDQRNHERLKECFLQMLSTRFINPQVTTVLPFYLQAAFAEVHNMPALKVYLPSPSILIPKSKRYEDKTKESKDPVSVQASPSPNIGNGDWKHPASESFASLSSSSSSSTLIDMYDSANPSPTSPLPRRGSESTSSLSGSSTLGDDDDEATILSRARLALSRTLQMVRECKEAMWEQYDRMYRHERFPPNPRLDRDDFEMLFRNWVWCVSFFSFPSLLFFFLASRSPLHILPVPRLTFSLLPLSRLSYNPDGIRPSSPLPWLALSILGLHVGQRYARPNRYAQRNSRSSRLAAASSASRPRMARLA